MLKLQGPGGEILFETRDRAMFSYENALEHLALQLKGKNSRKDTVKRQRLAALIRELDAFTMQNDGEFYDLSTMTDKDGTERYPWAYGKLLSHRRDLLFPTKADVDLIIEAVTFPTETKLAALPRHPQAMRKHEDPAGGHAVEPQGIDVMGGFFGDVIRKNFTSARSPGGFLEMLEVYAMALLRDVKFTEYHRDAKAAAMVTALNDANAEFGMQANFQVPVTPQNLFRGIAPGENDGLYVSQFLLRDFREGNLPITQVYVVENDDLINRTKAGYLDMIHGIIDGRTNPSTDPPRRVDDGRVMASLCHNDPAFSIYFNAALILIPLAGLDALDGSDFNSSNFLDTGGPDLLSMLGGVTRAALRASWSIKWTTAMKIRPETYAAHVQTASDIENVSDIPGFTNLQNWAEKSKGIIDEIRAVNQAAVGESTAFLPLVYPEGSPAHPSFIAGHAAVSGACVTVLKALSGTHKPNGLKRTWAEAANGRAAFALQEVDPAEPTMLRAKLADDNETVNSELNKLASNVALGRDFAGVHYRSDSDCGMKVGEAVALQFLRTQVRCYYPAALRGRIRMTLEKFNGEMEIIQA